LFELNLVVTEECNLRCTYCYMKKRPSVMTPEVLEAHAGFLPRILNRYRQDSYRVVYFGGEPLMNLPLIERGIELFRGDPRCRGQFVITNGLLLADPDVRDLLGRNGVGYSLSFDGLWNERNRPLTSGESSLPSYLEMKDALGARSCKVMVAPSSVDTMTENYEFFVEDFDLPFPDFSLVRDDVWTPQDVERFGREVRRLSDRMIRYILAGKETFVGLFRLYILDTLIGRAHGKRRFGCFAGVNGAGFMPDGTVYPCARFGSEGLLQIASSVEERILEFNVRALEDPRVTDPRFFERCISCSLFRYCNAGCTREQLRVERGVYSAEPVPAVCDLLHICYGESFRVFRELKDNRFFRRFIRDSLKSVG
jgi:uncharacterized protein